MLATPLPSTDYIVPLDASGVRVPSPADKGAPASDTRQRHRAGSARDPASVCVTGTSLERVATPTTAQGLLQKRGFGSDRPRPTFLRARSAASLTPPRSWATSKGLPLPLRSASPSRESLRELVVDSLRYTPLSTSPPRRTVPWKHYIELAVSQHAIATRDRRMATDAHIRLGAVKQRMLRTERYQQEVAVAARQISPHNDLRPARA